MDRRLGTRASIGVFAALVAGAVGCQQVIGRPGALSVAEPADGDLRAIVADCSAIDSQELTFIERARPTHGEVLSQLASPPRQTTAVVNASPVVSPHLEPVQVVQDTCQRNCSQQSATPEAPPILAPAAPALLEAAVANDMKSADSVILTSANAPREDTQTKKSLPPSPLPAPIALASQAESSPKPALPSATPPLQEEALPPAAPQEEVTLAPAVDETTDEVAGVECANGEGGLASTMGPVSLSVVQPAHVIQIGDELDILFPYQPQVGETTNVRLQQPPAKYERVIVRDDGMITAPLLPPVPALGRTPEELRAALIELYRDLAYDPVAARQSNAKRVYRISVNDSIEVRVRNQDDLNDIVLVAPDGRISLQRIGVVVAEGKTIEEIQKELTDRYAEVLPQPEITVTLRDFHSSVVYVDEKPKRIGLRNLDDITVIPRMSPRSVYVLGEVHAPRQVTYQGTLTLGQALASAGGHLRTAKIKGVRIIRRDTPFAEPRTLVVDYRHTLWGTAAQDIPLQHMDVIVLGKTPIAVVTDVLEQYVFNIFPFTRNNPSFNLFYNLGSGGVNGGVITTPGTGGGP